MDALSRIVAWLSDHEAMISAAVGIMVLTEMLFPGVSVPPRRFAEPTWDAISGEPF